MPSKIYNRETGVAAFQAGQDAIGNYVRFENGIKFYSFTTAITADTTVTTTAAGSLAITSHATGRGTVFFSDGSKFQKQL